MADPDIQILEVAELIAEPACSWEDSMMAGPLLEGF